MAKNAFNISPAVSDFVIEWSVNKYYVAYTLNLPITCCELWRFHQKESVNSPNAHFISPIFGCVDSKSVDMTNQKISFKSYHHQSTCVQCTRIWISHMIVIMQKILWDWINYSCSKSTNEKKISFFLVVMSSRKMKCGWCSQHRMNVEIIW